jgi:hypothetical protein
MYIDKIAQIGACETAIDWLKAQNHPTLQAAWDVCDRGDWMLWVVGKVDHSEPWSKERKPLVLCACDCARTSLPYTKDPHVRVCIETIEAWCRGEATKDQVELAAAGASDASDASDAAWAASDAAWAAWAVRAVWAARAAWAAWAAADTLADKQHADIMRKHYPIAPEIGE